VPEAKVPGLRELQLDMMGFLAAPAPEDRVPGAALGFAVGDERRDAEGRLGVYAGMYRTRLRDALAATVPMLARHLGETGFAELALEYFTVHPSRQPSLRGVAQALPGFLMARGQTALGDLAALEWARHDVFDAVDEPLLEAARLRELGPETIAALPIRTIAALRLVDVTHGVDATWRELAADRDPGEPVSDAGTLVVWREDVRVFHRRVDAVERDALRAAERAIPFAQLCETLAALVGEEAAPRTAGELLLRWVGDQMLVAG
jgi:hypothetical protein